ncbi:MAG TPA: helix-turn-helix domain-containing protein [Candidatus Xenobia bacterium]|jgi:excisionase family DNA binding protein
MSTGIASNVPRKRPSTRPRMAAEARSMDATALKSKVYLTTTQTAAYTSRSLTVIYRWIADSRGRRGNKRFPCYRRGNVWAIHREQLDQWLQEGTA